MNKLALLLTLFILTIVGVYIYYDKFHSDSDNNSLWNYISDDAIAVYEYQRPRSLSDKSQLIFDKINTEGDTTLNHIIQQSGLLTDLDPGSLLVSLFLVSKNDIGLVFSLDVSESDIQASLENIRGKIHDQGGSERVRIYNGFEIHEVGFKSWAFSYVLDKNALVLSEHSYLIEDVIRLINNDSKTAFLSKAGGLINMPKLSSDHGNVYIDLGQTDRFLEAIFNDIDVTQLGALASLDLNVGADGIAANGFTLSSGETLLKPFEGQMPQNPHFLAYIPNDASTVVQYGFDKPEKLYQQLVDYWKSSYSGYSMETNDFEKRYNFSPMSHWKLLKEGLCHVNFYNGPEKEQLLLIKTGDINQAVVDVNDLASELARTEGDSVYMETYGAYEIRELPLTDFPKLVYGPSFTGFESTYYLILRDMLVYGSSVEVLKQLIRSIESEETWGRSVTYNNFFSKGLEEMNVSLSYNLQHGWSRLMTEVHPKWQKFFEENEPFIKSFRLGTLQFSRVDDSFYTNLLISYDEKRDEPKRSLAGVEQQLSFTLPLTSPPYVVKNHNTNLREVVLQDSLNNLSLISNEGKRLWSNRISGQIHSPVEQIDFYNNKKLQLFTTTDSSVYIIDRLGNNLENYPIKMPFAIAGARVIDYDNSKNYRFLLLDTQGKVYLTDKHGSLLDGWNPINIQGDHAFVPFHVRVRGKDCFIFLLKDGRLFVTNRRGELLNKFPINLEGRYNSEIFVKRGPSFSSTELHILSSAGQLTKVTLAGDILGTEQLYKSNKETRFNIIPDELGKTYMIARRDKHRLVLLNPDKTELLAKDYLGAEELLIQYYYFNPDTQLFAITDPVQSFTYLYNLQGILLNSQPIDSDQKVAILYSESNDSFTVWSLSGDTYRLIKF